MVVLSPNFAVLASLAGLASMTLHALPANAVAIPQPRGHKSNGNSASYASASESNSAPLLPLPIPGLGKRHVVIKPQPEPKPMVKPVHGEGFHKRWDPLDPLIRVDPLMNIGDHAEGKDTLLIPIRRSNEEKRHSEMHPVPETNSIVEPSSEFHKRAIRHGYQHIDKPHVHPEHEGFYRRQTMGDLSNGLGLASLLPARRSRDDEVEVEGDDEHVHLHRRSPHRHHHDSDWHNDPDHSDVIVSGQSDHVNVHMKRDPRLRHRPFIHYWRHYWRRESSSSSDIQRRDADEVGLDPFTSGRYGVPGVIDIMSNVAGSSTAQHLASLVLSRNSTEPFILNASGTNQTQMYLVVLDEDTSPSTNTTAPAPSASPSTAGTTSYDASTFAAQSNSTAPLTKKVALQVPMFDQANATVTQFCVTFAKPEEPSPLTLEPCPDGALEDIHKSQVWSFDTVTAVLKPLWYNGEADGMSDDTESDDELSNSMQPGSPSISSVGTETDTSVDASAGGVSTGTKVSAADVGAAVSRLENLNKELDENASSVHNFAATSTQTQNSTHDTPPFSPSVQNVTMIFRPLIHSLSLTQSSEAASPSVSGAGASSTSSDSDSSAPSAASSSDVPSAASNSDAPAATSDSDVDATPMDAQDTMTTATFTSSSVATTTDSTFSSSSTMSSYATFTDSTATPSATPTGDHSLGVEVYDPSASTAAASSASTSISASGMSSSTENATFSTVVGAAAASTTASLSDSTSSTSPSSTSTGGGATGPVSAESPMMTPVSTAPYEWVFRETAATVDGDLE